MTGSISTTTAVVILVAWTVVPVGSGRLADGDKTGLTREPRHGSAAAGRRSSGSATPRHRRIRPSP